MIIPPSSLAVLLGSLARVDVGALLIAGMIPGLILACLFVALIRLQIALDPDAAPATRPSARRRARSRSRCCATWRRWGWWCSRWSA